MSKARELKRVRRPLVRAAIWAGTIWRLTHKAALGYLGAVFLAVGLGELAGHVWHRGLAPWVGLAVGGVFALLFGAELNRQPRPPDSE